MAKANLPVNFKDDILKENMNGKRRFNMIQNSDGTVSFEDVTDYTQVGSTFGAAQINATNEAVNNAADASKIIDSLETIKANTQSGYIAGALAVKELNSNLSGNNSWINPNPNKVFPAQSISLDLKSFSTVEILVCYAYDVFSFNTIIVTKGISDTVLSCVYGGRTTRRKVTVTDNEVTFSTGTLADSTTYNYDGGCIPLAVIGIR